MREDKSSQKQIPSNLVNMIKCFKLALIKKNMYTKNGRTKSGSQPVLHIPFGETYDEVSHKTMESLNETEARVLVSDERTVSSHQ